jgi:hypothetical protein
MIETFKKVDPRLLAAALLLAAGCNVSAQIPCADDSSCPAQYAKCDKTQTPPVCVDGKPTLATTSITYGGIDGHTATEQVRQTVHLSFSARATTGVQTVSLSGGGKTYAPATGSATPLYLFDVDTTQLTDGDVTLTATVTAGDTSTATAAATLHVDNTPPTVNAVRTSPSDLSDGTLATFDVTVNEPLSSITATLSGGGAAFSEISAPNGNVHHLGRPISSGDAEGGHDVTVTVVDMAGNTATSTSTAAIGVRHPWVFGTLTVTGNATVSGRPAAKNSTLVTASVVLPNRVTFIDANKPVFSFTGAGGTLHTMSVATKVVGATTTTWTSTFTVVAGDDDGIGTLKVTLTDAAGNAGTASATLLIDKAAPVLSALSLSKAFISNTQGTLISFSVSEAPASLTVTVNGNAATQISAAGGSFVYSYAPPQGSDAPGSLTVSVTAVDAVGNSANRTLPVIYDTSAPSIGAVSFVPVTALAAKGQLQAFSFTVTDDNAVSAAAPVVTVTPASGGAGDAVLVSRTGAGGAQTFNYSYLVRSTDGDGTAVIGISTGDAAGNAFSSAAAGSFAIDSTPPVFGAVTALNSPITTAQTLTITVPVTDCHIASAPTLTFTSLATNTPLTLPTTLVSTTPGASCLTTYVFTHLVGSNTTVEPNDNIRVTATALDSVGNTSAASTSYVVNRNGNIFLSPLTLSSPFVALSPALPLHITFITSSPPNGNPTVTVGGHAVTTFTSSGGGTSFDYTFNAQPGDTGPLTISVTVKDALNNDSNQSGTVTVDNSIPSVNSLVATGPTGAGRPVQITFSLTDDHTITAIPSVAVTLPGAGSSTPATYVSGSASGPYKFEYIVGALDAESTPTVHGSIKVTAKDQANNPNATLNGVVAFDIDRTPPAVTSVVVPAAAKSSISVTFSVQDCFMTGNPTVTFFDQTAGSTVVMTTPTVAPGSICASPGAYTYTHTTESNGDRVAVIITATDDAGNATTKSGTYVVDKTAPAITSDSFTPAISNLGTTTLVLNLTEPSTFTGTGTNALNLTSNLGGTAGPFAPTSGTTACNPCTFSVTGLGNGIWTGHVVLIDALSNSSGTLDTTSTFQRDNGPTISSVTASPSFTRSGVVTITAASDRPLAGTPTLTGLGTGDTQVTPCTLPSSTRISCPVTVSTTGGTRSFTLHANDTFGTEGTGSGSFTVDRSGPTFSLGPTLSGGTRVPGGSVVTVSFTVAENTGGVGIDPGVDAVVTVGGALATLTTRTPTVVSGAITQIVYVYSYTMTTTGTECPANIALVSVTAPQDSLTNAGAVNTANSFACDFTPSVVTLATYNRNPVSGNSTVSLVLTPNATTNGAAASHSIKVYDSPANAQANGATGLQIAFITIVAGPAVSTSPTWSDSAGKPYVWVRVQDAFGLVSILHTTVKTVAVDLNVSGQKQYNLLFDGVAQPTSPSQAIALGTPPLAGQAGNPVAVGVWERNIATSTTNVPSARLRPAAGFDPINRKLIVTGGADLAGGDALTDLKIYQFDLVTKTWNAIGTATGGATGCGTTTRFDAQMAYDATNGALVVAGGRCKNVTSQVVAAGSFAQSITLPATAGTAFTSLTLSAGSSTPKLGPVGALFTDDFYGGLTLAGFNDPSANTATSPTEVLTFHPVITLTAQATVAINRFGASSAPDLTASGLSAVLFGGLTTGTTTFDAANSQNALGDTLQWNGTSWTSGAGFTATPPARAYAAMASEALSSTVLMYAGTSGECAINAGTATSAPTAGIGCAKLVRGDFWQYTPTARSNAGDWKQIFPKTDAVPGDAPGASENGGSFNGFFDAVNKRFYVYRPVLAKVDAYPLQKSARVMVAFDASGEGVANTATRIGATITTTGNFFSATGVADTGTVVSAWDYNAGNWVAQGGLAEAHGGTTNTVTDSPISNPANFVRDGITYLLVETFNQATADNFDFKSVTVGAPAANFTISTP